MSLFRNMNKKKSTNTEGNIEMGYKKPRMIFTPKQEMELCEYAKQSANMFHGISPAELRNLAYEFAIRNGINISENWLTK